jgi:hypothetical protein
MQEVRHTSKLPAQKAETSQNDTDLGRAAGSRQRSLSRVSAGPCVASPGSSIERRRHHWWRSLDRSNIVQRLGGPTLTTVCNVSGLADAAEQRGFCQSVRGGVCAVVRVAGAGVVVCATVADARGAAGGRECGAGCGGGVASPASFRRDDIRKCHCSSMEISKVHSMSSSTVIVQSIKRRSVQSTVRTEFAATDPASAGGRLSDSDFCDHALARVHKQPKRIEASSIVGTKISRIYNSKNICRR